MPQLKAITLNNGTKEVIFAPFNVTRDGVAVLKDNSGDRPVAYPSLTDSIKEPGTSGTVYRTVVHLDLPVIETITVPGSSGSTVETMYTLRAKVEVITPVQSTGANRTELHALLLSALKNADIKSTIVDLEHLY